MNLDLKHIERKTEVQRRVDFLITRDRVFGLTEDETEELHELQIEYFNLTRVDTIKFRLSWCEEYEAELSWRHILAQSLAALDPATTFSAFRRKFDHYCDQPLKRLQREASDALVANKWSANKLDNLREDTDDAALLDELISIRGIDAAKKTEMDAFDDTSAKRKITIHKYKKISGKDDTDRDAFSKKLSEPKSVSGPMTVDDVDELFSALYDAAPWLNEAIKQIWSDARENAADGAPFGFDPVLIYGAPGLGKTYLASLLTGMSGCPSVQMNGGNMTAAFDISGSEKLWRNAGPNICVKAIHDHGFVNPLIVFDEIDKTPRGSSGGDPHLALLPLLQADTAAGYRCPYVQGTVDLSYVNWLACANDISNLPRPLLDRFAVFETRPPGGELLMHFLERKFAGLDVPRIKLTEMKRAVEKGLMSLRGVTKLETRLRHYDNKPRLN